MRALLPLLILLASCQADQAQFANMAQEQAFTQGGETGKDIQKLTNNFKTFPTSTQLNDYVESATSSPQLDCEADLPREAEIFMRVSRPKKKSTPPKKVKPKASPAAVGAKKVLATIFQSCDALDSLITPETPNLKGVRKVKTGNKEIPYKRKLYNTKKYVASHIVLSKLDKDPNYPGPMCRDMTKRPPVYGYGSRKYPNRKGEVNLFTKGAGAASNSRPAAMIDCSSFISVALGSQGLKVNEKSKRFDSLTTTNFDQQVGRKNSCLQHATFEGTDTVRPGDMINVAASHIVMIDQISDDPLGIKKYSKLGKCSEISISDFDFSYIHSGSIKNSYGPSRVHVSTHKGGTMFNNLRVAAVKQCKKVVAKNTEKVNSDSFPTNKKFAIIRHQSEKPSCVSDKKMKIKNEECIGKCISEHI